MNDHSPFQNVGHDGDLLFYLSHNFKTSVTKTYKHQTCREPMDKKCVYDKQYNYRKYKYRQYKYRQ